MAIAGKRIVVGVGGGIAAYKAVELTRELLKRGAQVRVVMTESATRFIGAATFSGITGKPAVIDLWDPSYPGEVHVELSQWADAMVIAPATTNLLARAAAGMADDAVLATVSCMRGPVLYAPAMHERMWLSAPTRRNVELLTRAGARMLGPVRGALASGDIGWGRLLEPVAIADGVEAALRGEGDLTGVTVLVSAGPTVEDLDPVRYLTNRSSGRMGFALASAAHERGAEVILVCGPAQVAPPAGVERIDVRSALDMQAAIDGVLDRCDVVIMTAAVADYRPANVAGQKIKKSGERVTLELVRNPDILAGLGQKRRGKRPVLVGFAMETNDVVAYARKKLEQKKVDLVIANEAAIGFGRDDTQATIVSPEGDEPLPPSSKRDLAHHILDRATTLLAHARRSMSSAKPSATATVLPAARRAAKAKKTAAKTASRSAQGRRAPKPVRRPKGR